MQRRSIKLLIQIIIIVIFIVTLVLYTYSKAKNLVAGPSITITSPINGFTSTTSLVQINGVANNISAISLNDRPIFIDESGNFVEIILLSEGYNALQFTAKDKFDREIKEIIELIYKPVI